MREEDSIRILVDWFQQKCPGNLSHYGYDVFLPSLIRWHYRTQKKQYDGNEEDKHLEDVFPVFAVLKDSERKVILGDTIPGEFGSQLSIDTNAEKATSL